MSLEATLLLVGVIVFLGGAVAGFMLGVVWADRLVRRARDPFWQPGGVGHTLEQMARGSRP